MFARIWAVVERLDDMVLLGLALLAFLGFVLPIARRLAKRTKTTVDDELVAGAEEGRSNLAAALDKLRAMLSVRK